MVRWCTNEYFSLVGIKLVAGRRHVYLLLIFLLRVSALPLG